MAEFLVDANCCLKRASMPAKSTNPVDYQDVPRPVAVMAKNLGHNHTTGWHSHKRAQLVFASSGVMVVKTHEGTGVIPPQRAVWVTGGMEHEPGTIGPDQMGHVIVSRR